jgi:hypothetical protein
MRDSSVAIGLILAIEALLMTPLRRLSAHAQGNPRPQSHV